MVQPCRSIENVDALRDWDVSKVNDMSSIFNGCRNLKNIDGLKNWDISSVTEMLATFSNNIGMTNLNAFSIAKRSILMI